MQIWNSYSDLTGLDLENARSGSVAAPPVVPVLPVRPDRALCMLCHVTNYRCFPFIVLP